MKRWIYGVLGAAIGAAATWFAVVLYRVSGEPGGNAAPIVLLKVAIVAAFVATIFLLWLAIRPAHKP
jgi:hypothetical protein